MSRRQLAALFACNLVPFVVGNSIIALLPVYATRLGADSTLIGFYLSSAFLALTAGTIIGGWLSDRFQRRKSVLIISGVLAAPVTWLMGQTTEFWQLAVLTAIVWFAGGLSIVMVNILTGLFAEESERGRIFGIVGLSLGLGALIGGIASGRIVDQWGFPALFLAGASFFLIQPLAGLFLEDKVVVNTITQAGSVGQANSRGLGVPFVLLFFASILAFIAQSVGSLGRPLVMDGLGFDNTAIADAVAISGALTLPLPFIVGWLSDRMGRRPLLIFVYLGNALGLVLLVGAESSWQFWSAAALQAGLSASIAVGSAMVTDMVPEEALGRGLSLFGSTSWIANVIGFTLTGNAMQRLGITLTFTVGAALPVLAILLLFFIHQPVHKSRDETVVGVDSQKVEQ